MSYPDVDSRPAQPLLVGRLERRGRRRGGQATRRVLGGGPTVAAGESRLGNQCVIFVGGLRTRPGERTETTLGPLLDVGGAPFLETLLGEARRRGFDDFLLLAGHLSEAVAAFLAERDIERRFACRVELSIEPTQFGTGGALVQAAPRLRDEFLLLNGDTWFDFNWLDLFIRARRAGAAAAIALRDLSGADRYDTIELDGDLVRAIRPRGRRLKSSLINGGVYFLTRHAIAGSAAPSSLEGDILPRLVARGALKGYQYSGFFIDIGVPVSLAAAAEFVPNQRRRPAVFFDRDGVLNVDHGYVHAPAQVEWVRGAKEAVKLTERLRLLRIRRHQSGRRRKRALRGGGDRDPPPLDGGGTGRLRRCDRRLAPLPVSPGRKRRRLSRGASLAQAESGHDPRSVRSLADREEGEVFLSATRSATSRPRRRQGCPATSSGAEISRRFCRRGSRLARGSAAATDAEPGAGDRT